MRTKDDIKLKKKCNGICEAATVNCIENNVNREFLCSRHESNAHGEKQHDKKIDYGEMETKRLFFWCVGIFFFSCVPSVVYSF